MKKLGVWKTDWLLGLIIVVVMLMASRGDLIQSLERKAYDRGVQAASRSPSDRIAVIAIDDASIANIGRWPWSREVHARMVDLLAGAKAKVRGEALQLGKLRVRTDSELRMHTFFYADRDHRPAFPVDSFFDVLSGKVPAAKFQDKIVLIGATAAGLSSAQVTPLSPATAPVL